MKVRITKSFQWSPDGVHVITVEVGELREGRCAEKALRGGYGLEERPEAHEEPAEEHEEKKLEQPANKAIPAAPRNKGWRHRT